jgi:hypothetical protein
MVPLRQLVLGSMDGIIMADDITFHSASFILGVEVIFYEPCSFMVLVQPV